MHVAVTVVMYVVSTQTDEKYTNISPERLNNNNNNNNNNNSNN